jgi:putative ABC transport system substrate-binding protein
MRRRDFITLLGGTAAWPLAARAQQPALPVIGVLIPGSIQGNDAFGAAFRRGLGETGYIEDQNVRIEVRWAEGQFHRFPALAADLVRRQVAVIIAHPGTEAALAAKAATSTIPIVFFTGDDPVKFGLVASLNRPGGNATGINTATAELEDKRLELLSRIVPGETIGGLVNPENPNAARQLTDLQNAARTLGRQIHILYAATEREIDLAFMLLAQERAGALTVAASLYFLLRRDQIIGLAARYSIPTIYQRREFAQAGGLVSYGTDIAGSYRQLGIYAGRILKGEKPADLPVMQPTKFEFVINLNTAKALGLAIPPNILALADEVIE